MLICMDSMQTTTPEYSYHVIVDKLSVHTPAMIMSMYHEIKLHKLYSLATYHYEYYHEFQCWVSVY